MWKDQLKSEWNNDPLKVIAIAVFAAPAVAKLLNALSAAQGRRAYAKQVNYRIKR